MKLAGTVLEELWFDEGDNADEDTRASESMAAKLGALAGLKPFPVVAQRTIAILNNADFRMAEATSVLEEDPSLAAGVLRVANSAFFAGTKSCHSISQAFVRMGLMAVKESVLSVAMMDMFPDASGLGKRIRDHCAATAAIVQSLTRDFAPQFTDGIFLSGLMHDVGKLLLLESGEHIYETEDMEAAMEPDRCHLNERETLGYDHAVLAGHVLRRWKIPEPIPRVVAWHHQPARAFKDPAVSTMVAMLRIADRLDWLLSTGHEDLLSAIEGVGDSPDVAFAGIDAERLGESWERIYHARADALAMFGG